MFPDIRPPITMNTIPDSVLMSVEEWYDAGFRRIDIVACAIAMHEHNVIDQYTRNAFFLASTI